MPITALNTTTLTAALTSSETRRFAVGATTNIIAGSYILIDGELMKVQSIPASGIVEVFRGVEGTESRNHAAASIIYIGSGTTFSAREFDGAIGLAGDSGTLPTYALPLGKRKRDHKGNEYVLCDFGEQVFGGTPVQISDAFTAIRVGVTGRGAMGVVAEAGATSNQWGWVQIYGKCMVQLLGATAGVSPSDAANGPTTANTTLQTKFWLPTTATSAGPEGLRTVLGSTSILSGMFIYGITTATDCAPGSVSAVTAATSHTGEQCSVFLNYPFIQHVNPGE